MINLAVRYFRRLRVSELLFSSNETNRHMKFPRGPINSGAISTAILAGFVAVSLKADYRETVLSQGPVGYWRLNETAQPPAPRPAANRGSLGAAGDGEYLFGPKRGEPGGLAGSPDTSVRFFNPNQDVGFGGSKIEIPFNAALNPNGSFSVEFWAKPSTIVTDSFCPVASINSDPAIGPSTNSNPRAGWLFYQTTNATGNGWQFRLGNANTNSEPNYLDGDAIRGGIVTTGAWHHIVGTYDGSTAALYVNGERVASRPITGYRANDARPFRIGTTCFDGVLDEIGTYAGNRGFDGWLQEVAFYGAALSATDIAAHYGTGRTNGAGYASLVLARNPIGYWRLGEPGNPPAANLGSLGADGNGQYIYSAHPGQGGPLPPAFGGLETDNRACAFSGTNGSVELPPLNLNTNTVTITAWILASEIQATNAGIVFSRAGTTVAGLKFDVNDPNGLSYNWNADAAAANFKSGLAVPVFQWCFVALIVQPEQATLCLHDGQQFSKAVNFTVHPDQAFEGPTRIGRDFGDPSRTFHGVIDEVAIFKRALSVGEVYSQYGAAIGNVQPSILGEVLTPEQNIFVGDSFTLSVDAGGTPPLSYQWRKGGVPISGATASTYSKSNVQASDAGEYDVVVSNPFGSATSRQARVDIEPLSQPEILQNPQGRTVYVGGSVTLNVFATGGGLAYQWQKNGTNLPAATNATYNLVNALGNDTGTYQVIVSNRLNTARSALASVTVIDPSPASFEETIVKDGPQAWWRLDDPAGTTLTDAMGRHDGVFKGGVTLGVPGVIVGNTNAAATFDGSSGYAEVPFSRALNTTNFTIECWVKADAVVEALTPVGSFTQPPGRGFLLQKSEDGEWFYLFGDGSTPQILLASGSDATYGKWTHLAMTYDGTNYSGYINGVLDILLSPPFVPNNVAPLRIGYDQQANGWDSHWKGQIDEVAFYQKALTEEQIAAHYAVALYGTNKAPIFIEQPQSSPVATGSFFFFAPVVEGSVPIRFQWTKNGMAIPDETNYFIVFPNTTFTNAAIYQLIATNLSGKSTSEPATLAVLPTPAFANTTNDLVLHLTFDGNFLDSSGRGNNAQARGSPTFVSGAIGRALHFSTFVDDLDPIAPVVTEANYVTLGVRPDLQFGSNVNFSVSYWVKFRGVSGDLPFFCNAINSYGNPGYSFAPSYLSGGWSWSLANAGDDTFVGIYGDDDSINDGQWHHLVHTFDRSGSGFTYLDGERIDSRSIVPIGDLNTGEPTNIGQDPTGTYPEAGASDIDDVGVWHRVLTAFEVSAIHAAGRDGNSFNTYGPVSLAVTSDSGKIQIVWQAGTLLEAAGPLGPWSPVTGAAPPYHQAAAGDARKFYRVRL